MTQSGIMAEIRALLAQDKSPKEVIRLGYKTSTVYRTQQQMGEGLAQPNLPPSQGMAQVVVNNNMEPLVTGELTELREEKIQLQQQLAFVEAQVMELDSLREELDLAKTRIGELEAEASQAQVFRARLAALEPEARATGEARKQSQEMETRLLNTKADWRQKEQEWQEIFQQEQRAHQQARSLADQLLGEVEQLKEVNQVLQDKIEQLPEHFAGEVWKLIDPMQKELAELRPLKVWVGHLCVRCHKPTSGVPSRELAGQILRDGRYGHGNCVK